VDYQFKMKYFALILGAALGSVITIDAYHVMPPSVSRATKLPNKIYDWRGQKIRYQVAEPKNKDKNAPSVLLIHGLFVNSDHWRKTLAGLSEAGYCAYAMDMLGCGYSSKPPRDSPEAQKLCGERGRFVTMSENSASIVETLLVDTKNVNGVAIEPPARINTFVSYSASTLEGVSLGTPSGGTRLADVDLRHPLTSPYNFFTWADQIADFCREVIDVEEDPTLGLPKRTTLVCNSVGTISSLQAAKDYPDLFNGVFIINPNFRELHTAEVPFPNLSMPFVRILQSFLRTRGQALFDALAKPETVAQILREPYKVHSAIDEELVDVLLTPLLTKGASDVVFDTLSYSAGPLPEQILNDEHFPRDTVPVWACYGKEDPWTPNARVERLAQYPHVEKVVGFEGIGHCPHDEAPELVNALLVKFLQRVHNNAAENGSMHREVG
jgi:pimeloyl-ACP methyl ester carboxylesterase